MAEYKFRLCMGCMEPKDSEGVCPLCGYSPDVPSLPEYISPGVMLNDRYVVGKLMRFNGEGADYIGYDTVTSSKVTIREYMPDTLCSRNKDSSIISVKQNCVAQYKAFMSEFVELNKMLAKMRSLGHINPAIDMFGDNNTGYVVFRYIEGINLAKYLKEHAGELTWDEVKKLFPPIFTTLSLVHNAGLIHRGISPENIIVDEKGELKLIGFCIADARTANTELASEVYSGYAAPEQYSSSNWQGTWTDVYGICALLYRILTGTAPTDAMDRMANDTLTPPRSLNGNIPANVSKVIMNGMNLSGELRIQTVTELVTQLFEEPDFNKAKPAVQTQTITISKQHSTKGSTGTINTAQSRETAKKAPTKKERPSRRKVFVITALVASVIVFTGMGVLMMTLDDNSSSVANGITTPAPSDGPELTVMYTAEDGSLITTAVPQSAVNASDADALPTLATTATEAAGGSDPAQTTMKPGTTVYIMNDLVGKNFDTVKNSPANENLTIKPDFIYTEEYEKGTIFEQSIEKGSNYEKGAELTLKISMGPPKVVIPEYYGLSKKDYLDILDSRGIAYEEKYYETERTLNDYVAWIDMKNRVKDDEMDDDDDDINPGDYIDLEAGEILLVYIAVNPDNTAPPETTTVSETTSEQSTAWVTTTVPDITTTVETEPIVTLPTAEPDVTIIYDY